MKNKLENINTELFNINIKKLENVSMPYHPTLRTEHPSGSKIFVKENSDIKLRDQPNKLERMIVQGDYMLMKNHKYYDFI